MKTFGRYSLAILAVLIVAQGSIAGKTSDSEVLLRSFIRFSLTQEVQTQAVGLAKGLPGKDADQIHDVARGWFNREMAILRKDLERTFGNTAKDRFRKFVAEYTSAEKAGDLEYLAHLSSETGLTNPPPDFVTLRKMALKRWTGNQISAGTRLLSEIQTWIDVRSKQSDAPPLQAWLARNQKPGQAIAEISHPGEPPRPVNSLANAEATGPEWNPSQAPVGSSMDAFSQMRREKRDKAMQDSQAGMQQMAMERQAAEQEYGARKMAEAQADADAVRAHAQKLAGVESEALAQRENSWGNRLKRIVGGTVSAGLGAFTGGIGREAGRRASKEIFD